MGGFRLQRLNAITVAGIAWLLLCASNHTQAHLLNMTKAQLVIDEPTTAELTLTVDLTREAGSRQTYYQWSQLPNPYHDPAFVAMLDRLTRAVIIIANGRHLSWHVHSVDFPQDVTEADFLSPVKWPMTQFKLTPANPNASDNNKRDTNAIDLHVTAQFIDHFKFEEPIALRVFSPHHDHQMNRWLVRNQQSPRFATHPNGQRQTGHQQTVSWMTTFGHYLTLGVAHIIPKGWDHTLFVLGILLGALTWRQLVLCISGFTLAHSATLALSSLGAIAVPNHWVEPAIALTLIYIAVENILLKPRPLWRFWVILVIGLIHGLGFAAVFNGFGLTTEDRLTALFAFNVGVELAQLLIVLVAWPSINWLVKRPVYRQRIHSAGSLAIATVGLFWLVDRL